MLLTLKNYYRKYNKNYLAEYLSRRELTYFKNSKSILDIGCGEGDFVELDPARIIGLDQNKKSLAVCKSKKLKTVYGVVIKLPFEKDRFEGIHCAHVIEHLYPKEAYKMLSEAGRVLKKNGILVISSPILWEGFYNDFTHVKPYNPDSIIRYLCQEGSQKTFGNIKVKFEIVDLYWRYRPFPLYGKVGSLVANYFYQFGFHSLQRNAYTLILKKIN
jgi:ubiquinone/menaquinone biosynthesis C-methylase UbiE